MFQQAKKLSPTIITILLWSFANLCSANESGLLWKLIAPNGTTSYIFGAMHSDDPRITSFSSTILQAMQESETFMPEVLPDPQASLFMDKGTLPRAASRWPTSRCAAQLSRTLSTLIEKG